MFQSQSDMNSGMALNPLQMSGAALPNVQPPASGQPGSGPQVVTPPQLPKERSYAWLWLIGLAAAAAAGYWGWQKQLEKSAQSNVVAIRTAPAQAGPLAKTLRLTGVTAAEKYVSLIAPSLRGGRGGGNNQGGGGTRNTGTTAIASTGGSSSGGSSSSSTGSSVASVASALASTSGAASGGGGGGSAFAGGDTLTSSAGASGGTTLRSARSASSGGSARSTTASRSGGRTAGASGSASLGSDGLGSTASQLPGGGGGGGGNTGGGGGGGTMGGGRGGSDFMMQLQTLIANGSKVAKGEQVAEFDRQYMLLRLDDYKANVEQAENSMKASLATLEVTRKSYEQQIRAAKNQVEKAELDMRTIPVRSAIEAERLKLALEEGRANLKQLQEAARYVDIGERATLKIADLDLQTSKLELRRAQANADRMVIKAPIDGLAVIQNTFRAGEFGAIQQGDQIYPGMLFMQVVDPSSMIINAAVSQVDVQHMRLGQRAKVRFDAFPGMELPAHVITIGAITKAGGSRASFKKDVPVKLRLDKLDPRVIPDLSVSADVVLDEADSATVVPLEAVMLDNSLAGAEPKPFLLVRSAAGRWERRDVQLGIVSNTHAAVASGLKPGEVVALEPPPSPSPDSGGKSQG